jgi:opine dehydrogenase
MNAILHPPGMVCNAGWIEASDGEFPFYGEGNGPAVARVMEGVDRERVALAERLDVPTVSFPELFHQAGFTTAEAMRTRSAYEAIRASDAIRSIKSPPTLDHRYLHEDVGWGLVQWMHLADAAGSPAPTIAAVTQLASVINGVDYAREGLTIERMGLAGMDAAEIRAHVVDGTTANRPPRTGRADRARC